MSWLLNQIEFLYVELIQLRKIEKQWYSDIISGEGTWHYIFLFLKQQKWNEMKSKSYNDFKNKK